MCDFISCNKALFQELDNFMQSNSSLQDLETVRALQEEVQYRYLKYLDYVGI